MGGDLNLAMEGGGTQYSLSPATSQTQYPTSPHSLDSIVKTNYRVKSVLYGGKGELGTPYLVTIVGYASEKVITAYSASSCPFGLGILKHVVHESPVLWYLSHSLQVLVNLGENLI